MGNSQWPANPRLGIKPGTKVQCSMYGCVFVVRNKLQYRCPKCGCHWSPKMPWTVVIDG